MGDSKYCNRCGPDCTHHCTCRRCHSLSDIQQKQLDSLTKSVGVLKCEKYSCEYRTEAEHERICPGNVWFQSMGVFKWPPLITSDLDINGEYEDAEEG